MSIIELSLQNTLIGFILTCFGFLLATAFSSKKKYSIDNSISVSTLNNTNLIIIVLSFLIFLKIFLHIGLGLGQKGVKPTSYTGLLFLLRLIPQELPYVLITIFLLKYSKNISNFQKVGFYLLSALLIIAVLSTGSKTFLLSFGLAFATYALFNKTKVHLIKFSFIAFFGIILAGLSFVVSALIKFHLFRENMAFGDLWNLFVLYAGEVEFMTIIADFSGRFSGLDGQILIDQNDKYPLSVDWEKLHAVYEPVNMLKKIIDNVIPVSSLSLTNLPSTGQAVGFYVFHYDEQTAVFGGALGPYASINVMFQQSKIFCSIFLFFWGWFIGAYFKIIQRFKNQDVRFIMYFFGCYLVLLIAISGNFDQVLALFIIQFILLLLYGFVVLVLRDIVKMKRLSPKTE